MTMRFPAQRPGTSRHFDFESRWRSPPPIPFEDASRTARAVIIPFAEQANSISFSPSPKAYGSMYSLLSRFTILKYWPMGAPQLSKPKTMRTWSSARL